MSIKTVETENEGLKRAFMLTIPAKDIEARMNAEVKRLAPQVRMPGFRPGKVPPNLIKKMHGDALQRDALNGAVQDGVQQLLTEQNVRPALQPEVELDEKYEPGKDAEVRVRLEALPDVPAPQIKDLKLERLTVEVDDKAVDAQLEQLASSAKSWKDAPASHKAKSGDLVVIDFAGKVGGDAVRRRHGRGHVGRARLGPADPRLRGRAGRRQGGRRARGRGDLPGRLSVRPGQGQARDLRRDRQGGQDRRPRARSTRISPSRSGSRASSSCAASSATSSSRN